MHHRVLIILLLCSLPLSIAPARQTAGTAPVYRLNALAANLADGPAPLRADLARVAIDELATAYREEAARARGDRRQRAKQRELWRWAAAVDKLATDYAALAQTILPDTPVEIGIGPEDGLYLIVAGRPVVVSSPRMQEQAAFEQRVITRFCELNLCDDLLDEPAATTAPAYAPPAGSNTARWSFSQQAGPVCGTADGLEFQFLNMENLGPKREACARVVAELNTLAAAIAQQVAGGIRVDWNALAIGTRPGAEEQTVILNGEGDFLRLALPTLAGRQELLAIVRPWLAARANGQRFALVVLHAGRLLAPPGRPLE